LFHSFDFFNFFHFFDILDNSAGLGAFAKVLIQKNQCIEVITGNVVEGSFYNLVRKPFHFFYKSEAGSHLKITAIDAYASAKKGQCLIAYANFATHSYMYHGGTSNPSANMELAFDGFDALIYIKSTKQIHPGEELLLPIAEHLNYIPASLADERKMNMNPVQFLIYENFQPHRCLELLMTDLPPNKTEEALQYITKANECDKDAVFIIQNSVTLIAGDILRYEPSRRLWANDNILDLWSLLLLDIDSSLCARDPSRKKTLIFGTVVDIFTRIKDNEWAGIERLYRKDRKKAQLSFLDYDRIYIPINEKNNHWTLLCIYTASKTMTYVDSFHKEKPPKEKDPKLLFGFLEHFALLEKKPFDRREWKFTSVKGVKQVT